MTLDGRTARVMILAGGRTLTIRRNRGDHGVKVIANGFPTDENGDVVIELTQAERDGFASLLSAPMLAGRMS